MKKKIGLLLCIILALTLSIGIMTACGGGGVSVTLSRTEVTVEVGKSQTIRANTSNNSDVEWESSDETVATVSGGKITGIKVGTATVTAKAVKGKGSAQCVVTVKNPVVFTFTDEDGNILNEVQVDRNGDPVSLSATASDGSLVTEWYSDDEKIATVENGVVTGLYDGDTVIYAKTSTATGKINVHVYDTFEGEKYDITDSDSATKWYYWVEHADITEILANEVRGSVTFGFSGGNWNHDSIKLMYKGGPGWEDWEKWWDDWFYFQAKIEADFDATINISGTRVHLHEGENEVTIKCPLYAGAYSCIIEFGTAKDGNLESGTIIITEMTWWPDEYEHGNTQLEAPSFTLDGDNVVITDTNDENGVEEYKLGLFAKADDEKPLFVQVLNDKNATIDASKFAENGDYYVKVMAVANPGYKDSAWSAASENPYTVANETIEYDVPEGGGSDAMNGSGWYLFMVDGGSVLKPAHYKDGELTLESGYLGWAFYSTELLYHCPTFANGTELLIAMKVNASHAGTITVSDTVVELAEGDNEIYVKKTQKDGVTVAILFGKWLANTDDKGVVDFPELGQDEQYTFVFSDISVTEYHAVNLAAVTGTVDSENKKISVNDSNEAGVKSYELGFFKDGTLMKRIPLEEDYSFSDESLNDGDYTLMIRAIATDVRYIAADWGVVAEKYTVANGGATYDVIFGGDEDGDKPTGNALTNPNTWYYWNDQNWTGSSVSVSKAQMSKGVLTIEYTVNSGYCDYGVQIYYKDPSLNGDKKLTLKIKTEQEINVTVNSAKLHLIAGENDVTVYYTQGGSYSFSMQIIVDANEVTENVVQIYDLNYEAYTYKTLETPQLSIGENDVITITDANLEANVNGYVIGYFRAGAANPLATVNAKNGDTLDYSIVDSGDYVLKVKAIAADNVGYRDSGWSAGFDYNVVNEAGAHYDLDTLFGGGEANDNPGRWGIWADPQGWTGAWVTVSEATFANNEIKVSFTSAGKSNYGLQINYVNPNYVGGTTYSFDIVATADMDIQVENGGADAIHLKAGEKVTLKGGTDASFYVQVNIKDEVGGTITISNISWN
ncbi:MAG: Ig-like domain-containing protein [Clostridia bacterium]|nr:Ig-like domain-containing protein [Clostridia bacterium]